jgi:hypothetical protein
MVWLVAAGPVAVILASMVTVTLAIRHPDPPLATLRTPQAVPAQQGRNHAATGVVPAAKP